jgi:hypothetical protein
VNDVWPGLSVKDGVATVSVIVVVLTIDPDVPVTVMGYVPVGAELVAEKVIELEEVVGFVPNPALTPLGSPLTDNVTGLLNPFRSVI